MWRGAGPVSGCRRMRYHRSTGTGPPATYSTAPLPHDVSVCPAPRYCDGAASPACDPEKPLGGVRMDDGVAGQISLESSHPPLMSGVGASRFPSVPGHTHRWLATPQGAVCAADAGALRAADDRKTLLGR